MTWWPTGRLGGTRWFLALLLPLLPPLGVLSSVEPLGAQVPSAENPEPQEVLLELRFTGLSRTTVRAFAQGNDALLPAHALMELAEIDVRVDAPGTIRGTLHPGSIPLMISVDSAMARVGAREIPLAPDAALVEGHEIFLAASVLEELLEITISTDWVALTTTVLDPEKLPLAQRMAREARWERLRSPAEAENVPFLDMESPAVGGAVLDWSLSNSLRSPGESLAYSLALGARVMEGSLRVSSRSLGTVSSGDTRVDATYERIFSGHPWLTQLLVGDGFTTGPRLRNVRGISLTNAPYFRGGSFTAGVFQGVAGPGWEVELRQSGRTVDLTRANEEGAFALDIPLRYGENAIQVVAFGPHGEVVTTDRILLAGADLIPGGTFEWGLSGGACRDQRCEGTGNLDLRYGVSNRFTLRGGTETFTRENGSSVFQPYLQATGLVLPSLQFSAEGVRAGFLRATSIYAPSPTLRMRGAYTAFSSELEDPILHNARRRSTVEADVFFRPDPRRPNLYLRGSLLDQEFEDFDRSRLQASAVVPVGQMAVESGWRRETEGWPGSTSTGQNFQFGAVFGSLQLKGRHRVWVRGELEVRAAEVLNRLRGYASYRINNRLQLNLAANWQRGFGTNLTVTFNALLSQLRSLIQLTKGESTPSQLLQYSQGSVFWNEATQQVNLAEGPAIHRGGISGYVFLDENGNGVRDPGEVGMEGIRLVVGGRPVITDPEGRHVAWDLIPYREVEIWADSASITDPTLVPRLDRVRVDVPPSSFGRLDVAITPSRQITGSVLQVSAEGGAFPIPYADVEMLNMETGEIRSFRAFSDGQFYEAGIRPGRYELRISRDYLRRAGLVPEEAWPMVNVTPEDPFQVMGPFELRVIRPEGPGQDGWIEGIRGRTGREQAEDVSDLAGGSRIGDPASSSNSGPSTS